MKVRMELLSLFVAVTVVVTGGLGLNAEAGSSGVGRETWQEEVLLHDGRTMVVERTVERGGRHEIGQKPPYKEQSLRFTVPGTTHVITWEDHYSRDLGQANFLPMVVEISGGTPYLVAYPMGCLSYNKWGRPNPPYVVFHYHGKEWKRIPLQELPADITAPNVIFSMPDVEVQRLGKRFITAEMIRDVIDRYKQPEFKTILREPVKPGSLGSTNCEERVLYKGRWILPNDPIAREFIDRQKK